jgi:hypothetical protein
MAEVQKVETGYDNEGNATYEYQFGAEVDGVFVPFVTKSGGYIDTLVQNAKAKAESESASNTGATASTPSA